MPLNRPALSLGAGPRGVQDARRWVVGTCRDIDRDELCECAELGTSELVSNALLHASPPLSVRVRGTREHPRVEVRDGSTIPPTMPPIGPTDEDDLLLTFGRGLGIVARCSDAWGVDLEEDGKTVWFAPSAEPGGEPVAGTVTGLTAPAAVTPDPDEIEVLLRGVPAHAFIDFRRHGRELRREIRLLALAHGDDYPLARDLAEVYALLERDLREGIGADQVQAALDAGHSVTDVRVPMPRRTATAVDRLIVLLDLADDFCREERLLSLARTPDQRRFQRWLLGELVRQAGGEPPAGWQDAEVPRAQTTS